MVWMVSHVRVAATAAAVTCHLLTGCSAGTSLLDSVTVASEPAVARGLGSKPVLRIVAYKPPMGPPQDIAQELTRQLVEAGAEEGIALVVDTAVPTDLALRGYLTSMQKGPSANISFLWDVLDSRGQRVHRVSGEQTVTNADAKRPWSAVTPAVSRSIAQRTMGELAQWARSAPKPAEAATPAPAPSTAAPPTAAIAGPAGPDTLAQ